MRHRVRRLLVLMTVAKKDEFDIKFKLERYLRSMEFIVRLTPFFLFLLWAFPVFLLVSLLFLLLFLYFCISAFVMALVRRRRY